MDDKVNYTVQIAQSDDTVGVIISYDDLAFAIRCAKGWMSDDQLFGWSDTYTVTIFADDDVLLKIDVPTPSDFIAY